MSSTLPGETVLDPFFGSGTTGAVAKKLGRNFIGIEREDKYIEQAKARIDAIKRIGEAEILHTAAKREQPRIPFGTLIENGMLKPGTVLTDHSGRYQAKVAADGNLVANKHRGSIHKVGAVLQGAPSCNGWTFWHYRQGRQNVPIDALRQQIRDKDTSGSAGKTLQ
jgi:modification methylase